MNFKKHSSVAACAFAAILVASALLMVARPASAQQIIGGDGTGSGSILGGDKASQTFTIANPLKATSIGEVVLDFIQIFSYVVILLAVLCLIWVGFQYIMASAQGNSDKIKELHGYLLWIVIGIAVVIGARVIVQVVLNTLSATGAVNSSAFQSAKSALDSK